MPLFGRDHNRNTGDLTQVLRHPLRLRILEVHLHERGRSFSVGSLTAHLAMTPGFEHVKPDQVNYHRNCLLDAELLPKR
jgi:hypothetical protein